MSERLLITIDGSHVGVLGGGGRGTPRWRFEPLVGGNIDSVLKAVATLLDALQPGPATAIVWLGSAWARLLCLDWPDSALGRDERTALLQHHWSAVLPDVAAWQLRVAERGAQRLSAAVPGALVDGLQHALTQRGLRPATLLPAICGALAAADVRDATALLDEGDRATLLRLDARGEPLAAISRRKRDGEEALRWATEAGWNGRAARLGAPAGADLPPCARWTAMVPAANERFIGLDAWASERPRRRDWLWLGSGAAAVAMAGAATVLLPAATDSAPAPRISESRMALVAQQTRALNGVTSRLETPWQAWLRDCLLELPAESGVLQLDIDPQQRRIKLVLDTADFAAVEAVIARLEASGHFAGLRSTGHDRDSAGRLRAVVEGGLLGVDAEAFSTAAGVAP